MPRIDQSVIYIKGKRKTIKEAKNQAKTCIQAIHSLTDARTAHSAIMKHHLHQQRKRVLKKAPSAGFTLIETLVAGVVVAAVMTAVGRLGVSAMATGLNQSSRSAIEAAINDHIQLLQMQDSYLTKDAITSESGLDTALETACNAPSTFLKNHLQKENIAGSINHPKVNMDWNDTNPYLLKVTYNFEAPEASIGLEQRITELNPNFSSQCYDLQ